MLSLLNNIFGVNKPVRKGNTREYEQPATPRFKTLPLIYPEKRLCLFFSAKAGCTFATKWFFFHQGILEEAMEFSNWVHDYRIRVYYKQEKYREELNCVLADDYTRIKLVRSPYQRAVSSYLHAIKTKYADKLLAEFLDREVNYENKFTFEEFVDFLQTEDISTCNPHHRMQIDPLELTEALQFNKIIKLEESFDGFNRIEKETGLEKTNMEKFSQSYHHTKKIDNKIYCGNVLFKTRDKKFGEYKNFYNQSSKSIIRSIYAVDFESYDYSTENI